MPARFPLAPGNDPGQVKRRLFLKSAAGVAGAGLFAGLYTWQVEPFWLEFVQRRMPVQNLPDHLLGKTLMQISDIHVGKRFDKQFLVESFAKARLFNPDFVVYTGDYVTTHNNKVLYDDLAMVLKHCVRGQIGTAGILGNHDYGRNWAEQDVSDRIASILEDNGIAVLRNSSRNIAGLNFIGLDDYWALNFNPALAMNNYSSAQANIVLCHNPDVCDLDVWNNYQGWILSGHTHGGQCKPPFLGPPMLPVRNKRYTAGHFELTTNRHLYINRALGHLWQVRFNVRPEITIFELAKA